jgi:hypothetical protein
LNAHRAVGACHSINVQGLQRVYFSVAARHCLIVVNGIRIDNG